MTEMLEQPKTSRSGSNVCCQARTIGLTQRIKESVARVVTRRTKEQQEEYRIDQEFRRWAMAIVGEMGTQKFQICSEGYRTEIVNWSNEVKVVLMKSGTRWSDIESKGRFHPWFVQLVKIEKRGDDYWSVNVRSVGKFHRYADLPDGTTDCYCRPENRDQRIPELREIAENALIEWIE